MLRHERAWSRGRCESVPLPMAGSRSRIVRRRWHSRDDCLPRQSKLIPSFRAERTLKAVLPFGRGEAASRNLPEYGGNARVEEIHSESTSLLRSERFSRLTTLPERRIPCVVQSKPLERPPTRRRVFLEKSRCACLFRWCIPSGRFLRVGPMSSALWSE